MTIQWRTLVRVSTVAVMVPVALLVASCSPEQRRVVAALGQVEQVDFYYLLLPANQSGDFTLNLHLDGTCRNYSFSRAALEVLLRDRQLTISNVSVPFTFEALEKCLPAPADPNVPPFPQVKITNDQLSQAATDAAGATIRVRPQSGAVAGGTQVDARLSGSGQLEFRDRIRGVNLVGAIASGSKQPGPGTFSAAEFSAGLFGRSGVDFTLDPGSDYYTGLELKSVSSNPERFAATFALTAAQAGVSDEVLLIWDGDLVLRTDL
jgi:hypothetical protein